MIFLFYIIEFLSLLYFILKKRKFDFLSLAYFSQIVYFIPAFLGVTYYMNNKYLVEESISDKTYIVLCIFVFCLIFITIITDLMKNRYIFYYQYQKTMIGEISLIVSIISLFLIFEKNGLILFKLEKKYLMNMIPQSLLIMEITAIISSVVFYLEKKYKLLIISLTILSIDLFIGFRYSLIIVIISIIFIYLNNKGEIRLINLWKEGIFLILLAFILLISKEFMYGLKFGFSNDFVNKIINIDFYLNSIKHSEPFTIMSILNEVVIHNFEVPLTQLNAFIKIIPFSKSLFNYISISYNDKFQKILFPNISYGMANNILAQMWSLGGYIAVVLFSLLNAIFLVLGNKLLNSKIHAVVVIIFSLQAFYIFRNDLLYQITLEKKILLIYFVIFLNYIIFKSIKNKFIKNKGFK